MLPAIIQHKHTHWAKLKDRNNDKESWVSKYFDSKTSQLETFINNTESRDTASTFADKNIQDQDGQIALNEFVLLEEDIKVSDTNGNKSCQPEDFPNSLEYVEEVAHTQDWGGLLVTPIWNHWNWPTLSNKSVAMFGIFALCAVY